MEETKTIFKWWWGWTPEKIETWLEEKEAGGWHLDSIGGNLTVFRFTKKEPRKVSFSADFQTSPKDEYQHIYKDSGWNLTANKGPWYIWSQEYQSKKPEAFTDNDSLVARMNRLLLFIGIILCSQVGALNPMLIALDRQRSLFTSIIAGVYFAGFAFLIFVGLKILMAKRRLKKQG